MPTSVSTATLGGYHRVSGHQIPNSVIIHSLFGGNVDKRVILARGTALSTDSGLGRAHHALVGTLRDSLVEGWEMTRTIDHEAPSSSVGRVLKRFRHASVVSSGSKASEGDLLHITDQEQAHLVPRNCEIPVVVTVHDMFHLEPSEIESVPIGEHSPGMIRRMDLRRLRKGLERADLIICISEITQSEVNRVFPGKPTALVRHKIDADHWDPSSNPMPIDLISEEHDPSKCLLITVGSDDPRKRIDFIDEVESSLPSEISDDIEILHIGSRTSMNEDQIVAAYQAAEALLFPSLSEGFGYPPFEAMASGCPVLAADFPAHNEVIPDRCLLDSDVSSWVGAIVDAHSSWKAREGEPRSPDQSLIDHIREELSPQAQGSALSQAYASALSSREGA